MARDICEQYGFLRPFLTTYLRFCLLKVLSLVSEMIERFLKPIFCRFRTSHQLWACLINNSNYSNYSLSIQKFLVNLNQLYFD